MKSTLSALGQQLLACADEGLLDLPLDTVSQGLEDDEVRAVLGSLHEAGEGHTLRDVLGGGQLARWVDATCTAREEQALCVQLRRWLGFGQTGEDDPARLTEVPPPPTERARLLGWARCHGLLAELTRPVLEVLPGEFGPAPDATLLAVLVDAPGPTTRGTSLLGAARARDHIRAYLHAEARSQASLVSRSALWARALPEGQGRRLAECLRATLGDVALATLHSVRFVPAQRVTLDVRTGVCRGRLQAGPVEAPIEATLLLSGYEQRAIEGTCSQCKRMPCLHVRALAARLLDACLDPGDRLHAPVEELIRVPSWLRFLSQLADAVPGARAASERLCFVVRVDGERASVGVWHQKRGANGRWSAGKLTAPQRCLRMAAAADRDRPVLEAMSPASRTLASCFLPANLTVLRSLAEHPVVQWEGSREALRIVEQQLHVELSEQPEGLVPSVSLDGQPVTPGLRAPEVEYVFRHDPATASLIVAPLTPALRRLLFALSHFRGVLPPQSYSALAPFLASLREVARVSSPSVLQGTDYPIPRQLLLRMTPTLDEGIDVALTFRALPLGALWPPGQGPELVFGLVDGGHVYARRDLAWERDATQRILTALNLAAHLRIEAFAYRIESREAALSLLSDAARLGDLVEIEWAERARPFRVTARVRASDLKVRLFKKGQWFTLQGGAHNTEGEIAVGRLLEAARRGERFVAVRGRDYLEIEHDLYERLAAAQLCVTMVEGVSTLPVAAGAFWLARLGVATEGGDTDSANWLSRVDTGFAAPAAPVSPGEIVLRDYQREGVAFLLQRSSWAPGACLADEMGLGKTVQAIAVLAERAARGPALVVTPTSLVDNWASELARFAPHLTVYLYRGAKRRKWLAGLGSGQVLVTTYDLLLRDRSAFDGRVFATHVVDEAQVVKNARTQRARAVARIACDFRIALSGTPVENRLGDLWSLFQLIAPGLLGSWARFRARFAVPIERYENQECAAALRALVGPFVLRRTKREVAKELPARTELVHMVALSPAEQALYDAAVVHARRAVGKHRRHDAGVRVHMLAELTRLRQLACHPRLVVDDDRVESSKLAALVQLLEDILPRGHRVLVFSQFTRHLALVREAVTKLGVPHLYLDGSTPPTQRGALVDRFQGGDDQVFLISLKAGGTGLNLTAADYVVHMDPWWNPAAEDQASDRAHRIGQHRPVTIVKLVTQGTIEEKVLALHGHKRWLADAALSDTGRSVELDARTLEGLLRG